MSSRHAPPIFVTDEHQEISLERLELGRTEDDLRRRESFIQDLVHDRPGIIPMAEIEPAMTPLISVCRELPAASGSIDNFWITPWGGLVIGECKLVRNPQARREVIAQVLDYARIMSGWTYEDLERAVRKARKDPAFKLWSLVEREREADEAEFVDAVERRLRRGQILLLVIGDGIQEGVEALTAHLHLHAGMHAALALVELSLWRGIAGGLLVVPRIPMRTVLIERGIVSIERGSRSRSVHPARRKRLPPPRSRPPLRPNRQHNRRRSISRNWKPNILNWSRHSERSWPISAKSALRRNSAILLSCGLRRPSMFPLRPDILTRPEPRHWAMPSIMLRNVAKRKRVSVTCRK